MKNLWVFVIISVKRKKKEWAFNVVPTEFDSISVEFDSNLPEFDSVFAEQGAVGIAPSSDEA